MKKYVNYNKNPEALDTITVGIGGEYFRVEIYDYSVDKPCFEIREIVNGIPSEEAFAYMGAKTRNAQIIKDGKTLKSTTYASYDENSLWSPDEYYDHLIDEVAEDLLVFSRR